MSRNNGERNSFEDRTLRSVMHMAVCFLFTTMFLWFLINKCSRTLYFKHAGGEAVLSPSSGKWVRLARRYWCFCRSGWCWTHTNTLLAFFSTTFMCFAPNRPFDTDASDVFNAEIYQVINAKPQRTRGRQCGESTLVLQTLCLPLCSWFSAFNS